MLDKYKTKERKEVEDFLSKDNPFGSYNSLFGGMDAFMNSTLIFVGIIVTFVIWYSSFSSLDLPIFISIIGTIIIWGTICYMIFKNMTE